MKLRDHFDYDDNGRAILPPAEVEQIEHDTPPAWLPVVVGLSIVFWGVVLFAAVSWWVA